MKQMFLKFIGETYVKFLFVLLMVGDRFELLRSLYRFSLPKLLNMVYPPYTREEKLSMEERQLLLKHTTSDGKIDFRNFVVALEKLRMNIRSTVKRKMSKEECVEELTRLERIIASLKQGVPLDNEVIKNFIDIWHSKKQSKSSSVDKEELNEFLDKDDTGSSTPKN